jgi:hypothetical protein
MARGERKTTTKNPPKRLVKPAEWPEGGATIGQALALLVDPELLATLSPDTFKAMIDAEVAQARAEGSFGFVQEYVDEADVRRQFAEREAAFRARREAELIAKAAQEREQAKVQQFKERMASGLYRAGGIPAARMST